MNNYSRTACIIIRKLLSRKFNLLVFENGRSPDLRPHVGLPKKKFSVTLKLNMKR